MGGGYREPICDPVLLHQMRVWCACEAMMPDSRFWIKPRRPEIFEPEGTFVFRYEADRILFRLRWSEELARQRSGLRSMAKARRDSRHAAMALIGVAAGLMVIGGLLAVALLHLLGVLSW